MIHKDVSDPKDLTEWDFRIVEVTPELAEKWLKPVKGQRRES